MRERLSKVASVALLALAFACGDDSENCDSDTGCGPYVCDTGLPETKYCTEIQALSAAAREVARNYCEPYLGSLKRRSCSRQGVLGACRSRITHGDNGTTVRTRFYYQGYEVKTADEVRSACEAHSQHRGDDLQIKAPTGGRPLGT
jgi:hypothetical protein